MRQVVILSGVSGAGKSTYAEKLLTETQGIKVSADHYFMWEDTYKFDPTKLGEAHADCFKRFISHLQAPFSWSCVVVDNTQYHRGGDCALHPGCASPSTTRQRFAPCGCRHDTRLPSCRRGVSTESAQVRYRSRGTDSKSASSYLSGRAPTSR